MRVEGLKTDTSCKPPSHHTSLLCQHTDGAAAVQGHCRWRNSVQLCIPRNCWNYSYVVVLLGKKLSSFGQLPYVFRANRKKLVLQVVLASSIQLTGYVCFFGRCKVQGF